MAEIEPTVIAVPDANIGRIATLAEDVRKYGCVYHKRIRVRITCQSPYSPGCSEVIGIDAEGRVLYDYSATASIYLENMPPNWLIWE